MSDEVSYPQLSNPKRNEAVKEIWDRLNTNQRNIAREYLKGKTLIQASLDAGMSKHYATTVPDRRADIYELQRIFMADIQDQITEQIRGIAPKAVQKLREVMDSENEHVVIKALKLYFGTLYEGKPEMENNQNVQVNVEYIKDNG